MMFTSTKPPVPRSIAIVAATLSAIAAAVALIATASAQTGPGQNGTTAQSPEAGMARCSQLFAARSRYHANGSNYSAGDTEAALALEQCKAGRFDTGIASLEGLLKMKGIPVPQAETAGAH